MRKKFFELLEVEMEKNPDIIFMTGDLGFNLVEGIREKFPDRFYNMQTCEFAMTGVAIGMAYSGKIPIIYSIAPFIVYRNFELLRTYINHEKIPVKIVGAGRDKDYKTGGISHWAHDVDDILCCLRNIRQYYPCKDDGPGVFFDDFINLGGPAFMSLQK